MAMCAGTDNTQTETRKSRAITKGKLGWKADIGNDSASAGSFFFFELLFHFEGL
jgi:hypothetical protein